MNNNWGEPEQAPHKLFKYVSLSVCLFVHVRRPYLFAYKNNLLHFFK